MSIETVVLHGLSRYWLDKGTAWGPSSLGLASGPHSCSLKWKLFVLHWVMSQFSMVRSVKLTFPSRSMRMTVLVLWWTDTNMALVKH